MDNYKKGEIVRVKGNGAGHNYAIGTQIEIVSVNVPNSSVTGRIPGNPRTSTRTLYFEDIEKWIWTKEEINANIKKLETEIATERLKLKFLQETKTDLYDPEVFQAYQVLKTVSTKKSNLAKAQAIVKILRK